MGRVGGGERRPRGPGAAVSRVIGVEFGVTAWKMLWVGLLDTGTCNARVSALWGSGDVMLFLPGILIVLWLCRFKFARQMAYVSGVIWFCEKIAF